MPVKGKQLLRFAQARVLLAVGGGRHRFLQRRGVRVNRFSVTLAAALPLTPDQELLGLDWVMGRGAVATSKACPTNQLIAQQDNLPVEGLAPTNTWQPQTVIRDPYRLLIPENAPEGTYRLHIGLYNEDGRPMLQLPDNRVQDYLEFPISIPIEASDH